MKDPHLISVDELRAAGALDVPAAWRKSLGGQVERDLFSDLPDEGEEASAAELGTPNGAGEYEQGDG